MIEESNIFEGAGYAGASIQVFHDFKLLKTTANASLYLAFKAGKRFLIKTTKDNSEQQNKMLRREYELSLGCDHPHLVHIYTIENLPFGMGLVMEYIEGGHSINISPKNHRKRSVTASFPNSSRQLVISTSEG